MYTRISEDCTSAFGSLVSLLLILLTHYTHCTHVYTHTHTHTTLHTYAPQCNAGATPVTSLAAVAVSNTNFTLQISWDLPLFPNGRIQNYVLQYRQLESNMGPVSVDPGAKQDTVEVVEPFLVIHGLPPFTFFEVTVTANNGLPGFPTSLTVRTNASGEPSTHIWQRDVFGSEQSGVNGY